MKKYLLSILMIFAVLISHAQLDEKSAKKKVKEAVKALNLYNLDFQSNSEKLEEGIAAIDEAMTNSVIGETAEPYLVKGNLLIALNDRDIQMPILNPEWKPKAGDASKQAFEAYKLALTKAEKKHEKEDALTGLSNCVQHMNNRGLELYQMRKFEEAYQVFNPIFEIHQLLLENGKPSQLADPEILNNQYFITGYCGLKSGHLDVAEQYLQTLIDKDYDEPTIYEGMFDLHLQKGDKDKAVSYLDEGMKKYPGNATLLFAQINLFLKEGRTNELVDKLELAIEKEENNKSLYLTLGNVHEQLYNAAVKEEDAEKTSKHYDEALVNYKKALDLDEKYVEAIYSVGALYYNKAAGMTQKLNEMSSDYSKEGIKKYDAMKLDIEKVFDEALPFFKRAESINPNDINTLIALKEIYARKNQLDLSNEFKTRLEAVQAGGKNESSYFNED